MNKSRYGWIMASPYCIMQIARNKSLLTQSIYLCFSLPPLLLPGGTIFSLSSDVVLVSPLCVAKPPQSRSPAPLCDILYLQSLPMNQGKLDIMKREIWKGLVYTLRASARLHGRGWGTSCQINMRSTIVCKRH